MDQEELEKIWEEMMQETFNTFIEQHVGYEPKGDKPTCYGSGDNMHWCFQCNYKSTC